MEIKISQKMYIAEFSSKVTKFVQPAKLLIMVGEPKAAAISRILLFPEVFQYVPLMRPVRKLF